MRSGRWWKRGRGLAAENLLLSTSVISVSPWRNKKFKGNQRSWRISLAYFQWATLEAGMGELRVYPMQKLINVCCVYMILQAALAYVSFTMNWVYWLIIILSYSSRPWFYTNKAVLLKFKKSTKHVFVYVFILIYSHSVHSKSLLFCFWIIQTFRHIEPL